jgi:hypothetical protein
MNNLKGRQFSRLLVMYQAKSKYPDRVMWHCLCDCGVEVDILAGALTTGHAKSCGCLKRDLAKIQMTIHGLSKTKEYKLDWAREHKDHQHAIYIKCAYGITGEQYNAMFEAQGGCCAICGKHQSEFKQRLHVDHNHRTGTVRALLCKQCNIVLGFAQDDIEKLEALIVYLKEHEEVVCAV